MAEFVRELGVGNFDHVADGGGSIWNAFSVTAQPSYVFIEGSSGDITRQVGGMSGDGLEEQLEILRSQ